MKRNETICDVDCGGGVYFQKDLVREFYSRNLYV